MIPFLKVVADDLYERYGENLSQVTIVTPNKRAKLFFNKYLSEHITDRPIWAPRFITIGQMFQQLCPLHLADPIQQICTLYEAYIKTSGRDETLDKFYSWAELMKNDFEDIDNNLANAKMLFANIEDLESMKDLSFLSENQQQAIRQYFDHFEFYRDTPLKQKFLELWNFLYPTYTEYRRLLRAKGLAYSGMLKREVIEQQNFNFDSKVYAILGFNVLNETERQLFKAIKRECPDTLFYWDYDEAYTDFEAGRFIKANILEFGNALPASSPHYKCFAQKKQIRYISSPTENAQTRYVNTWIDEKISSCPQTESAIVLCNENILQPVLHSLPDMIGEEKTELNVTMGYPLYNTPIFSFITSLLNLQNNGKANNRNWRYSQAAALLKHPYTKMMVGEDAVQILSYLKRHNIMFPRTDQLIQVSEIRDEEGKWVPIADEDKRCIPFLESIFVEKNDNTQLIEYLIGFTRTLGKQYKEGIAELQKKIKEIESQKKLKDIEKKSDDNTDTALDKQDFELQLYAESIFTTYSILNRVHTIKEREPVFNVTNQTLSRLLIQILKQQTIPFHGEPAKGLQVMGILETRNLDFRNVLLLSCGEGQFPKSDRMASLIPYSLREAYGMTTIDKQISLYAYNFYNLLQRADNVTVIYNGTPEGPARGEMSRFMMQLMVESKHIFGSSNVIDLRSLTAPSEGIIRQPVSVEKTDEVMQMLDAITYISPSAINAYIDCPLKFYFGHVVKFYIEDEVTEDVDNRLFGNIFHKSMEILYKGYIGRQLTQSVLEDLAKNRHAIESAVDAAFAIEFFREKEEDGKAYHPDYSGEHLLNRHVIIKYVTNQIKYDATLCPFRIIGLEVKKYASITISDPKLGKSRRLSIGGIIDRLEEATDGNGKHFIRIIDYKTSAKAQAAKDYYSMFDETIKDRPHHILQAMYYCEVMDEKDHPQMPLSPSLMYVKTSVNSRSSVITIGKDEKIYDYVSQSKGDYTDLLHDLLAKIFIRGGSFDQNSGHACGTCKFKTFCNK